MTFASQAEGADNSALREKRCADDEWFVVDAVRGIAVRQDVLGGQAKGSGGPEFDGGQQGAGIPRECVVGEISLTHHEGDLSVLEIPSGWVDLYFLNRAVISNPADGRALECSGALLVVPGGEGVVTPFRGRGDVDRIRLTRSTAETFAPHALAGLQFFPTLTRLDQATHSFIRAMMGHSADRRRSSIEDYASEQIVLELAGSTLLEHCGSSWAPGSASSALRDEAMAVIAQRCADKHLKPEAVAKAVQSSLRRVQAAFAEVGNSIAAEIRRQRGRLARNLLTDSRYDVLSVQQIAEQTGFGTTAALRRALDELYGCGPRELREGRAPVE
jgi:AraC-like DNA-binding protein